jgi:hypothetical protein
MKMIGTRFQHVVILILLLLLLNCKTIISIETSIECPLKWELIVSNFNTGKTVVLPR